MPTGLVADRGRVAAGLVALLAAAVGVASLTGRAVVFEERGPLLVAVRLLLPLLLALGGHLIARRRDERGPVLLVGLGLLLAPAVSADLLQVIRIGDLHPLALGGLLQNVLGLVAAAFAWVRLATPPRSASTLARVNGPIRVALVAAVVVLALAELYASVTGPLVGALQPLVVVLGVAGLPTVVAALGVALIAVLVGRARPGAGALALGALAVLTLGQVALLAEDVLGGQVVATLWLWARLTAGLVAAVIAGYLALLSRADGAATDRAPAPGPLPGHGHPPAGARRS